MKRNYLETQAKRKLLWGNKPKAQASSDLTEQQKLWANLSVGDDQKTDKFQKVNSTCSHRPIFTEVCLSQVN